MASGWIRNLPLCPRGYHWVCWEGFHLLWGLLLKQGIYGGLPWSQCDSAHSFNHKVPWAAVQIFVLGRVHSGILNKMVFGWKLGVPIWKHFFIGYRLGGGVRKNKHNNYVVNVNKKEQVKQIKMFCFAEALSHSHDSRILLDFMTIYNCFSIRRQRMREAKEIPRATGVWWTVALVACYRL